MPTRSFPADDLEAILRETVDPWTGRYLTNEDVGDWKGYTALVWNVKRPWRRSSVNCGTNLRPKFRVSWRSR